MISGFVLPCDVICAGLRFFYLVQGHVALRSMPPAPEIAAKIKGVPAAPASDVVKCASANTTQPVVEKEAEEEVDVEVAEVAAPLETRSRKRLRLASTSEEAGEIMKKRRMMPSPPMLRRMPPRPPMRRRLFESLPSNACLRLP